MGKPRRSVFEAYESLIEDRAENEVRFREFIEDAGTLLTS